MTISSSRPDYLPFEVLPIKPISIIVRRVIGSIFVVLETSTTAVMPVMSVALITSLTSSVLDVWVGRCRRVMIVCVSIVDVTGSAGLAG